MTPYEAAAVLAAFQRAEENESLMWRVDMESESRDVELFALCSDFFHLATADCEEIEAGDLPLLGKCLADLTGTGEEFYLGELFAARKRKMRPHKSAYKGMAPAVAALFDGCSTEDERAGADRKDATFWSHVARKARAEGKL